VIVAAVANGALSQATAWTTQKVLPQASCEISQQFANVTGSGFDERFRGTNRPNATHSTVLGLVSQPPAAAQVQMSFGTYVARDITDRFPFVVIN
jgi:hypothetical protein